MAQKRNLELKKKKAEKDLEELTPLLQLAVEVAEKYKDADHRCEELGIRIREKEEKLKNGQDIWHTFDGLPGLELSLPLLLNAAADGTLSFEAIAKATAESTAEMLGLAPKKGRIEAGADADMVLVAKNQAPVPLDTSKLFTKARGSAVLYEGIPMHYRIVRTYVRGRAVYEEGRITGEQGWGTFVSPAR